MKKIKGNVIAQFQIYGIVKNDIGEEVKQWVTIASKKGFLDLSNGNSSYGKYNAKTVEATHIFICDPFDVDMKSVNRLLIGSDIYDVTYFDNPMGMGFHYEVYLKEISQNAE